MSKIDEEYVRKKYDIDKERGEDNEYRLIDDLYLETFDGKLNDLEKRIKEVIKSKNIKWKNGDSIKYSECSLRTDHYYDHVTIDLIAERSTPETDEQVIKRLIKREKSRIHRENKKRQLEKQERALLEKLKQKYEG